MRPADHWGAICACFGPTAESVEPNSVKYIVMRAVIASMLYDGVKAESGSLLVPESVCEPRGFGPSAAVIKQRRLGVTDASCSLCSFALNNTTKHLLH